MKKYFIFWVAFLLSGILLQAQHVVTIGTGTSTTYEPISGYYGKHRSVSIYTPADGLVPGTIQNLAWNKPSAVYNNIPIKIYLKEVSADTLSATSSLIWNDLILGATLVYEGMPTWTAGAAWVTIPLQTSFTYGTGNIMILVASNKGGSGGSTVNWAYTASGTNNNAYIRKDSSSVTACMDDAISFYANSSINSSRNNQRPNIQFGINPAPGACFIPSAPTTSSPTSTGVSVTWAPVGSETQWTLSYKDTSSSVTTWAAQTVNTNPTYTISGLTPLTWYYVKIKANCSSSDTSYSSAAAIFRTACPQAVLPLTEGFEATGTTSPVAPECWSYIRTYSSGEVRASTGTPYTGSKCYYMYHSSTSAATNDVMLISPYLVENLNTLRITFWAKNSSSQVRVGHMINPTDTATFTQDTLIATTSSWVKYKYAFNNVTTTNAHYIALSAKKTTGSNTVYLDDITIELIPACADVENIASTSATTNNSITLSFTTDGITPNSFNVEYRKVGETAWQTTTFNASPGTITGLASFTEYEIRIKSICGSNVGGWCDVVIISTECDQMTLPITEGFETTGTTTPSVPDCWKYLRTNSGSMYASTSSPHSGSKCYYINHSSTSGATTESMLISPYVTNLNHLRVVFWGKYSSSGAKVTVGYMSDPTNATTFRSVKEIALPSAWTKYKVNFDTVTATASKNHIVFSGKNGSSSSSFYIDDVTIELIPACPDVENVVSSATTDNSITLTFTVENGATPSSFNVEYREVGETTWQTTTFNASPGAITGLTQLTTYEIRIRSICGSNMGVWSDAITASTKQTPVSIPFAEDFEGTPSWVFVNGTHANKWVIGTAANTNNTAGGSHGLYVSNDNGATNEYTHPSTNTYIYATKSLQFTSAGDYAIEYDWKAQGESASYDYLQVWLAPEDASFSTSSAPSTSNWINLYGTANLNLQNTWQHKQIVFAVPQSGVYKLVFYWYNDLSGGSQPPAAVDNISITELPCSRPTGVSVDGITSTNAVVHFHTLSNAQSAWLYYKNPVDIDWDSTNISISNPASDTIYTLTNLNPATTYQFYFKTDCQLGEASHITGTYLFTTGCGQIAIPHKEGFETTATSSAAVPACWSYIKTNTGSMYASTSSPYSGSKSYYINHSSTNAATTQSMLISPSVTNLNNLRVTFWAKSGYLTVGYMSDSANVSTFNAVRSITAPSTWTKYSVYFDTVNATASKYHIAFSGKSTGTSSNTVYIDDITIESIPACGDVVNIVSTTVTDNSITLSFDAEGVTPNSFNVEYRKVGETTWQTTIFSASPGTIVGLAPMKTYEIHLQGNCGSSTTGAWSNTITATTKQIPAVIPFTENFEDLSNLQWAIVNGTQVNKWYIDTTVSVGNGHSAYISNNNGLANTYTIGTQSATHIYRDVEFPTGTGILGYTLTFDWKAEGEGTSTFYDYLQVSLKDTNIVPVAGTEVSSPYLAQNLNFSNGWNNRLITLSDTLAGKTKRLIFSWKNDGSGGAQSPVAIDNIEMTPIYCTTPAGLKVVSSTATSIDLIWSSEGTSFDIEYKKVDDLSWESESTTDTIYTIGNQTALDPNTAYQIRVRNNCGLGDAAWVYLYFNTMQIPADLPFTEDFEGLSEWVMINGNQLNKWFIDTVAAANNTENGEKGMYISSAANGSTYNYVNTVWGSEYVYATKAFNFESNSDYIIDYDWKCNGESSSDYLLVWLIPSNVKLSDAAIAPTTSTWINAYGSSYLSSKTTWQEKRNLIVRVPNSGIYRLAFQWVNNSSTINQPPAAIDNIFVEKLACSLPTGIAFSNGTTNSVDITCKAPLLAQNLRFVYESVDLTIKDSVDFSVSDPTVDTLFTITNLPTNTEFTLYAKADCSGDFSLNTATYTFRTTQIPESIPFTENFEGTPDWVFINGTQTNKWVVGTAANVNNTEGGTHGLYISNDNGVTNAYTISSTTHAYATKSFTFTAGEEYLITYDWKNKGEDNSSRLSGTQYDCLRVLLMPGSTALTAGSAPTTISTTPPTYANAINLYGNPGLSNSSTWQHKEVFFDVTTSGIYNLVMYWYSDNAGGTQPPATIDNISITASTCPRPQDLATSNITDNSADLTWNSPDANFTLDYKASSDTLWTTMNNISSISTTLTNLTSNTNYQVRLRTVCGAADTSFAVTASFKTECGTAVLPIVEGFETTSTTSPSAPDCWSYIKTGSGSIYASTTERHTGSKSYNFYNITPSASNEAMLISPLLTDDIRTVRLKFWMRYSSTAGCALKVGYMSDPTDASTFNEVASYIAPTSWTLFKTNFDTVQGIGQYIAISANKAGTASANYLYIDDITIELLPVCPDVENLASTSATDSSSITLSFTTAGTTPYSFNVEYKEAGTTAWQTTTFYTSPGTITNLTPNTTYVIRVQSDCGNGVGEWSDSIKVTTLCGIAILPLTESFETTSTTSPSAPTCWSYIKTGTASMNGSASYAHTGSRSYYMNMTPSTSNEAMLVSPLFGDDIRTVRLKFWMRYSSTTGCAIKVGYMSDPTDASTFNEVASYIVPSSWTRFKTNFDTVQGTGQYIAISANKLGTSTTGNYLYIDDITIELIPLCADIDSVKTIAVTDNSITFTVVTDGVAPSSFNVEYKPVGTTTWQTTTVSALPGTITGLTPNTTYQFRLQSICGSNFGVWSDTARVNTTQIPISVPFSEDFEGTPDWVLINGTQPSKWVIDTATHNGGTKGLYVSTDSGRTNSYANYTYVYAAKAITFATGSDYKIQYDWKCDGEGTTTPYDYLKVMLMPANVVLTAGSDFTSATEALGINLYGSSPLMHQLTWQTKEAVFTVPQAGVYNLVFFWRADMSNVYNPPAAIDNISIKGNTCLRPENLTASNITDNSADLTWTSSASNFTLEYKTEAATSWTVINNITTTSTNLTSLVSNTNYQVRLKSICNATDTSFWLTYTFRTACENITLPLTEGFENTGTTNPSAPYCWSYIKTGSGSIFGSTTYAHTGTKSYKFEDINPSSSEAMLISPLLPQNINTLNMTFWMRYSSTNGCKLKVGYLSNPTNISTFTAVDTFDVPTTWTQFTVDFTTVSGTGRYIGISAAGTIGNYIYIDDITISAVVVSCAPVTTVSAVVTGTSVKVDWTAPAGQTQWKASCLQAGTPVASQIVSSPTHTFNSLQRGASYTFEVRNICGTNDTSVAVASPAVTISNCTNVTNVTVVRACPTSAIISFTAAAGQNQWQMSYQLSGGATVTRMINRNRDTLTGLTPNSSYEVKIRPVCGEGDTGTYSAPVAMQTGTCSPVENLTVPRVGASEAGDSIFVSWNNNECHLNWEMSVVPNGSPRGTSTEVNTYQGVYYKLADPSQSYDIYVRGNCGDGEYGEWVMATSYPLGIARNEASSSIKVTLAPNPARDYTQLSIEGVNGEVEMTLLTLEGKLLKKQTINCQPTLTKDITLQGLSKGTYLIRLVHKNWTKVEKLIVQ